MLDTLILHNSARRWLIAAAIIIGSIFVGRLLNAFVKALTRKLQSKLAALLVEDIGGPVTILLGLFGVRIGIEPLVMPDSVRNTTTMAMKFLVVISFTWLVVRVYGSIHKGIFEPYAKKADAAIDLHLFAVARTIINVLVWVVGITSGLNSIGFEVSAILAGIGIGGMAIALASQDSVANIFGGLIILTQRPFKVGERIEVAGIDGWVYHIGLRNTVIKNWYGRLVQVPNKKFTDSIVVNIDSQGCYYFEARLKLDPRTTPEQLELALTILREVVRDNDLLDKSPWVMLDKLGHGFFEIEIWYAVSRWTAREQERFANEYHKICAAKTRLNLDILKRFDAAGLRLALPMELQWNAEGDPNALRGPKASPPAALVERQGPSGPA